MKHNQPPSDNLPPGKIVDYHRLSDDEILQERAVILAGVSTDHHESGKENREYLCIRLSDNSYLLPFETITEVFVMTELVPVPGTIDLLAGITPVRGRMIPVVGLKPFLRIPQQGISSSTTVVLSHTETLEIGLLVDHVEGIRSVPADEVFPPPASGKNEPNFFISGIASDEAMVLDIPRLVVTLHQLITHQTE